MVLSPEWLTAADVLASDEAAVELVTSGASAQLCFARDKQVFLNPQILD